MGALILISGANGSGKSRFAENLLAARPGPRRYIATMTPETEDNLRRVEKHRAQRAGLDFVTLELPLRVGDAPVEAESAVLLEDVSNLLANRLFQEGGGGEQVLSDILALGDRCRLLAAVTIAGLRPEDYAGETAGYITQLNWLNDQLRGRALAAVRLENGCPHWEKGGPDEVF